MLDWREQGLDRVPASRDTHLNSFMAETVGIAPLGQYLCFSVDGDPNIAASISSLLGFWYPLAVTSFVIAVVVDTLDAVSRWALTHIRQKVRKGSPAHANGDAASTVAGKAIVIGFCTPTDHIMPTTISSCLLVLTCAPMFETQFRRYIPSKTTTRFCIPRSKPADPYTYFSTTVTKTIPNDSVVTSIQSRANCYEAAKALIGDIKKSRHIRASSVYWRFLKEEVAGREANGFSGATLATGGILT
jgi:hypothetical protein